VTTGATTQKSKARSKRRSLVLLSLAFGVALSAVVTLAGTAPRAEAAFTEKVVFASDRTKGTGVNNPTGDYEIFKMSPDGSGLKQLTINLADDSGPILSPDGKKIAYISEGIQTSNPEGDQEVYAMNALDGTGKKNLSNNGSDVYDYAPIYFPGSRRIAYTSDGEQTSNPEGDSEVYLLNALDGSGQINLTHNGLGVSDFAPDISPDGQTIAYTNEGDQASNPEGDRDVFIMNASDGSGKKNLSNNGAEVGDTLPSSSPSGKRIAYQTYGVQNSNPEGEDEVYVMNATDGTGKKNLSNNGVADGHPDFSPDGTRVTYESNFKQRSNPEGDPEIYRMNAIDGSGKKNLSNNGAIDYYPDWDVQAT
jgi:Tol biopolymer transport system component